MLLAGAGGFAGSVLRYAVSVFAVPWSLQSGFPVGTFAVNAAGSFLIGLSAALLPAGGWQTFAMAGFCGGFTTFSTFSLESVRLLRAGETHTALLYIGLSLALCLGATALGMTIKLSK